MTDREHYNNAQRHVLCKLRVKDRQKLRKDEIPSAYPGRLEFIEDSAIRGVCPSFAGYIIYFSAVDGLWREN